ncbi:methyltransferase [Vibrio anguillarum]|uniref:Methyltransferase n=1 Tax=Vibrio anguillarum TaxID=55601 RepID=A0A289GBF4_VIBAN|nr:MULTISPECIES: methyltransferase [Vibrio]ASW80723.1 methyltransferase [Vibrio anguillarum]AXN04261.1 methyltransferase [Vibrio anguillarum]AZS25927.1 methyltransferase [Vibrio anguillarum]MBF4308811.1 methyltransferase [Vibrio anguillarum]MBF4324447.1 methyltransferase [Vibrio anguillarum]
MRALFKHIDAFLIENQRFWRFEPFHHSGLDSSPWKHSDHRLDQWLQTLSLDSIDSLKSSPQALIEQLHPYIEGLKEADIMIRLQDAPRNTQQALSPYLEQGIPGRKLEQIRLMSESLLSRHSGTAWLEWCAGKGFLGRIIAAQSKQKVTSFEYQSQLCHAGQACADEHDLPMQFIQGDAFEPQAFGVFNTNQHAVALHACGDLHVRLLEYSVAHRLPAITFSPCCYHLIKADSYQPMSSYGRTSSLALSKEELRIPLQETVTGGERVRRHRLQEMTFRLGFDLLLRSELGHHQYCPIPSLKKSQLAEGFLAFCYWAAAQKGIALPEVDWPAYERKGEQRFWQMERIGLVQQAFRRMIELWLVLDKALYLQEQGYEVQIEQFCARKVTPRNILVHAFKK